MLTELSYWVANPTSAADVISTDRWEGSISEKEIPITNLIRQ